MTKYDVYHGAFYSRSMGTAFDFFASCLAVSEYEACGARPQRPGRQAAGKENQAISK